MPRPMTALFAFTITGFLLASPMPLPMAGTPAEADDPLAPLAFLAGTWQGTMGENDFVEEVWSEANGSGMMGMFRWLNPQGRPRMYEILTLSSEGEDVLLRLRHFTAEMVAWEERQSPVVLKMNETDDRRAAFVNVDEQAALERIVFFAADDDGLGIDVLFRAESGRSDLKFEMKRAK